MEAETKDYKIDWDGSDLPDPFSSSKWSSCTDASCGADGERSPSPPPSTTDLYPDKASKSLVMSLSTSTTKMDLSPGCSPNGASSEATVSQTGMWTAVEARMQLAVAAMTTDTLVTASTAHPPALPTLSATFPFPTKAPDAKASGGNGMSVAEVVDNGVNAVGTSPVAATTRVPQKDSPQPLGQCDIARNDVEKGVAITSRDSPAGAVGAAVDLHLNASTSTSMSASTWAESSSSPAPLPTSCDGVGLDGPGFDLGVIDEDLMVVANILLGEGLFEGETGFQNVE